MAQGWVERGLEDAETEMNLSTTLDVDDDGRPRRTGTLWTASSHIITAVIGSGVLSLGWAMAQLGWLIGPFVLFVFSAITLFTSRLLADCYRSEKTGKRNYNYVSAVKSNLGSWKIYMCGICQYVNLCGTSVGYCITSGISAAAVIKSNCFHEKGHDADCNVQYSYYMVGFGMIQIVLSQLPDLHNITWLSVLAAVMSFSYSIIGVVLAMYQVISGDVGVTSLTGTVIGVDVTGEEKVWNAFQALGNIAFAYSYSMVLIEIQDTLKSPLPENKVMKKASFIGVTTTTVFYMFCGCFGYAAFGNKAPGNMLTGFGFYEPFWLVDIANICIVIHLLGAYQVFCQPIFAVVEDSMSKWKPGLKLLTNEVKVLKLESFPIKLNMFRMIWRTTFVVLSTTLAIMMPFFNGILGFLGAVAFWPLTVYFPIEMFMAQKKIKRLSPKGMILTGLSSACLLVSLGAAIASIRGVLASLSDYEPFQTRS